MRGSEKSANSGAAERPGFRRDVEGLRAVAILLVVLYHVNVHPFTGGYVGVDVFFVISGFLITGQLARELESEGKISFLAFYARRARRILPAATLVTISTVVASALLLTPLAARRVFSDAIAAVFFGANFRFAAEGANYFDAGLPASPLQHFWSLSVEEQFYVVWPLLLFTSSLMWVRGRRAARRLQRREGTGEEDRPRPAMPVVIGALCAVATLSFLASVWQTTGSPSWAYYSIVTRAWELAVGALTALALPMASRIPARLAAGLSWIGLACIGVAATLYTGSTPYPGHAALLPVAGAAAVVAGGSAASKRLGAQAILGTPPFQRLGSWSYSWYLWHWPFLILAPALLGHALSELEAVVVVGIALIVAVLSFVLVERPIRRMQIIVRRPAIGLAGGALLALTSVTVLTLAGLADPVSAQTGAASHLETAQAGSLTPTELAADLVAGVKTHKVPSNLTPPLASAASALPIIVTNGCHLEHSGTRSKPCIYGDTKSHTSVVLFGDSHAAAWFPALETISKEEHWRLVDLTKAGCPPPEVAIVLRGSAGAYPQCTEWRTNSEAYIANLHPALVIAIWARYVEEPEAEPLAGVPTGYGSTWDDGVEAIFKFLHKSAQHLVFISDTPTQEYTVPDCVSGHPTDIYACTTPLSAAIRLPAVKAEELKLAKQNHIDTIDPTAWFCDPKRCPAIVGNIILYRDNAHMVPQWSDFIAPVLADSLVPIVTGKPA